MRHYEREACVIVGIARRCFVQEELGINDKEQGVVKASPGEANAVLGREGILTNGFFSQQT